MPEDKVIGHVILEGQTVEPNAKIVGKKFNKPVAEGVVQTGEEDNRNGRAYLTPDLAREISCPRTTELIRTGNMKAEEGHPMDSSMVRQQTIDPGNTSAKFLSFEMKGNDVWAVFTGTNNTLGQSFCLDLLEGELPSWSLRALGSLENIRGRNIVRNLKMITYDRVIYPSHSGAYTHRLISEGHTVEKTLHGKTLYEIQESGLLLPIMDQDVVSYIKSESANIGSILTQIDVFYESISLIDPGHVKLVGKNGDTFIVNLEAHISKEIEDYCISLTN